MMSMSPLEPNTIYASLWDVRRQGWTFRSGGPGSGLYKSTDGGEHWTELTDANSKGLPAKPYGRIAMAVAPGKPQVVYANIEAAAQRTVPFRRWRQNLGQDGCQPVHGVAAVLFRQPDCRSQG